MIPVHEQRQRERAIQAKLRMLRSSAVLPIDTFYAQGEIDEPRWSAVHEFREDREAFLQRNSRGRSRRAQPSDARPKKPALFSMMPIGIERGKALAKLMLPDCYDDLLRLIGEIPGHIDAQRAKWVAREVWQYYSGNLDPALRRGYTPGPADTRS